MIGARTIMPRGRSSKEPVLEQRWRFCFLLISCRLSFTRRVVSRAPELLVVHGKKRACLSRSLCSLHCDGQEVMGGKDGASVEVE